MEELLTGNYDVKKVYSPEEHKYIYKLVQILRGNEEDKKTTIKTNLDSLKRDVWEDSPRKTKQLEVNLKKTTLKLNLFIKENNLCLQLISTRL